VGLDLSPVFWLRFCPLQDASGILSASLWVIDRNERTGWSLLEKSDLAALCHGHHQMTEVDQATSIPIDDISERILLLTLTSQDSTRSERDLAELEGLVRSAGATPVAVARQKLGTFNPQTIWGTGKLQEVALEVRREKASLVITDRELTPGQARNLERLLTCPVMDRSELILDIFAQRASSATGRLQVELAQLRYRKSRLVGRGKSLSRQGGGIGTRGPGETQLEKDRRLVVSRIERLGRQLSELKKHRSRIRNRRKNLPRIALVGYTNAGKSSLLNALCGLSAQSEVLAENKLFATLDPTTRRLIVPQVGSAPRELLITDTVGFIRELPAPLMEAFSATLEETLEADCLLLLVDLSNPDWSSQLATVNQVLDSLGANVNRQIVANKIDCCDSRSLEAIRSLDQNVIYVSATSGAGLQGLKLWLQEQFWDNCSASSLVPDTTNQYE
jgi:GTP-binding protein HflX